MKSFLRENPTIAFGLGLPLILVVVFLLVSGIPSLLVASPQHDVLYATEYHNYQNFVQISVVEQKVQVTHHSNPENNQRSGTWQGPRLWRYTPETGAVKEIPIMLPPNTAQDEVAISTVIDIPELAGLTIDSSSIAPDGYEFSAGRDRYSGNVFRGLFYSSRNYNEAALTKSGRVVRLPNAVERYYSRNTQFVGWVVSQ